MKMNVISKANGGYVYISTPPTKKELEKLTIDELVKLLKHRRSVKYGFKKFLVDHALKVCSVNNK